MPKHLRTASIAAASLAALAVAAPAATAAEPYAAQDLYVATAGGGKLARTHTPGVYRLTLAQPAPFVTTFTDHPARSASAESTRAFVSGWKAAGFEADPPNAALVVADAPATRDISTFELSHPRITKAGAVVFRAKRIGPPATGALEQLGKRADRPAAGRFGRASLYVDGGAAQSLPLAVSIRGLAVGQSVSLNFNQPIELSAAGTLHLQTSQGAGTVVTDSRCSSSPTPAR